MCIIYLSISISISVYLSIYLSIHLSILGILGHFDTENCTWRLIIVENIFEPNFSETPKFKNTPGEQNFLVHPSCTLLSGVFGNKLL